MERGYSTVEHENETLIPALLLDADLVPRPEFRAVIAVLAEAGEDGWGLWAWLVHPTSWLDGRVPAALLFKEPKVVLDAARSRASNAPSPLPATCQSWALLIASRSTYLHSDNYRTPF